MTMPANLASVYDSCKWCGAANSGFTRKNAQKQGVAHIYGGPQAARLAVSFSI
jgi:hypothetical protein